MKLFIFDLDQTLVDFIGVHDAATRRLFQTRFGVDARLSEIDFAGRSLHQNLIDLAKLKNISETTIARDEREILADYAGMFIEMLPEDAAKYILPGARELLERLSATDNVMALYTGEPDSIAEHVLDTTHLNTYFDIIVTASQSSDRVGMVRLAVNQARQLTTRQFRGQDIVIIGDSIRDIDCGKEFQALTVAVATGFHTKDQLLQHQPDYLLETLEDFNSIFEAVTRKRDIKLPAD